MSFDQNCENILSIAKLQPKQFYKLSQTITFSEDYNKENYYIFQANNEILNSLHMNVETHLTSLSIKGNIDEIAVLCTESNSYEIRESETSNTLLISPNLELNYKNIENDIFFTREASINSTCNKIYELTLRKPKIGEIYKLLQNSILFHHIEDEVSDNFLDFPSLLDKVRMSENELKDILFDLKVYKVKGYLRLLNIKYICDIVLKILDCSFENDFSIWNFSQQNVYILLKNLFPTEILDQALNFYFVKVSDNEFDTFWKANEFEITRCIAEDILNNSNELSLEEFLNQWNKKLPEELTCQISNLFGLAVITDTKPQSIKLLKSVMLPDEPEERFKSLFSYKSNWKQEELEGFIQDIIPKNSTASQLMTRYCRCSTRSDVKTFSKR